MYREAPYIMLNQIHEVSIYIKSYESNLGEQIISDCFLLGDLMWANCFAVFEAHSVVRAWARSLRPKLACGILVEIQPE